MSLNLIKQCSCCGGTDFTQHSIIWDELVQDWRLSKKEHLYIDRQQGYTCNDCGSNLRSMNLASAIMKMYRYVGIFEDFVKIYRKKVKILEVNEAGHLNRYLSQLKNHILVEYPEVNFEYLPFENNSFDLVVHSDTLEHVKNPIRALSESLRVLKPGGITLYTIPIVVDRLTRKRNDKKSYHGSPGNDEYLVITEYGADMWTQIMQAGFSECRLISYDYPASIVVCGVK